MILDREIMTVARVLGRGVVVAGVPNGAPVQYAADYAFRRVE